jgi:hypothetical protein
VVQAGLAADIEHALHLNLHAVGTVTPLSSYLRRSVSSVREGQA